MLLEHEGGIWQALYDALKKDGTNVRRQASGILTMRRYN
jgi:hypothetical protein